MIVRPLRSSDSAEEITHLLHRAYARNAAAGLRFSASHQSPEITAERLNGGHALVAESEDRIVGTLTVSVPEPQPYGTYAPGYPIAAIAQFAVDPDRRGEGIGDRLMEVAERLARDSGCREIALDTARPASGLIARYERCGYRVVAAADWRPVTNYESLIMTKPLHPDELLIRAATPEEYPALAEFKGRAFHAVYLPLLGAEAYEAFARDASAAWFETRVAEGHVVLVALRGGEPIGFAAYGPNTLDAPADRELRNVYVDPEATSRGTGRALVDAALGRMRAGGVRVVSLGVFPSNVRAIAFYERLGFVRHKRAVFHRAGVAFEDQIMILEL